MTRGVIPWVFLMQYYVLDRVADDDDGARRWRYYAAQYADSSRCQLRFYGPEDEEDENTYDVVLVCK